MLTLWTLFFLGIAGLLALDLGVFHRRAHVIAMGPALGWSAVWIGVSLAFNVGVYFLYEERLLGSLMPPGIGGVGTGAEAAMTFFTGYLLEKSLSVDNIFVMAMLFSRFRVEGQYQHRVLFWGILGAIVFRSLMIGFGVWLVTRFDWLFYVFGTYLVYAGARLLFSKGDSGADPDNSATLRLLGRVLPIGKGDHGGAFIRRREGRVEVTRLFVALIAIELTDVLFAFDSVPAVLAITTDTFIVLTSNIFAILGLRALYFVLAGMLGRFHYLQLALALVLVVIGAKMLLHDVYHVSTPISLAIIGALLALGIGASLARLRRQDRQNEAEK